jgi:hypothetical protein
MVQFSKIRLDNKGNPVLTDIREIPQSAIMACPHTIFVAGHYREDGSCKCDDPNEKVMAEWGYTWSDTERKWI